jgi:hemin uptake protein HemP
MNECDDCSSGSQAPNKDSKEQDPPRSVASEDLFGNGRVVLIQHAGEQYRLLITRNNRLILQK